MSAISTPSNSMAPLSLSTILVKALHITSIQLEESPRKKSSRSSRMPSLMKSSSRSQRKRKKRKMKHSRTKKRSKKML
jgi:hypothetical protein